MEIPPPRGDSPLPEWPGVSYVMPVLNEARYIEAAVRSILAQDYPGEQEIVLSLGPSNDGTDDIVHALAAEDARIRYVENPQADIPIGLNLAIAATRHPVIIRVDAHSELSDDYSRRGVQTLRRTGAASLGGIMSAKGKDGFQSAVARAYNSRLGLGGGSYHREGVEEGPAESAYMGIMRADLIASVGGYDETLRRGEDWELNYRLLQAGHKVWLDPELQVTYWPRSTFTQLRKQMYATGVWRAELVRRLGGGNPLRFFAPPLLLLGLLACAIIAVLQVAGVLTGVLSTVLSLAYLGPIAYVALLVYAMVTSDGSLLDRLRFAGVLATMHLNWSAGFLVGLIRGAGHAKDKSRVH